MNRNTFDSCSSKRSDVSNEIKDKSKCSIDVLHADKTSFTNNKEENLCGKRRCPSISSIDSSTTFRSISTSTSASGVSKQSRTENLLAIKDILQQGKTIFKRQYIFILRIL